MGEFGYVFVKDTDNENFELDYEATYRKYKDLYSDTCRLCKQWHRAFRISIAVHGIITIPLVAMIVIAAINSL